MRLSLSLSLGAVALCSASPLLIFDSAAQTQLSPAQTLPAPVAHLSLSQLELLVDQHEDPVALMALLDPSQAEAEKEPRFLKVHGQEAKWMTEGDKMRLRRQHLGFMDLTDHQDRIAALGNDHTKYDWPAISHQQATHQVISRLKVQNLEDNLSKLTSFYNRFYKSHYGAESSHWIYLRVLDIAAKAPPHVALSVRKFTHPFAQSSIIARFEPPAQNASLPVVVIGAHQDSANYRLPLLPAPGADDDGSGTVTILEAFRALVEQGFTPEVPVEFHWYAAEEGGLLGSQDIVKSFVAANVKVRAMIQFDMTAFSKAGQELTVTLIDNEVNLSLTNYTVQLAEEYSDIKVQVASLFPGAGSDHMSFNNAGYPAAFGTEGDPFKAFDPYVHTIHDRMDLPNGEFNLNHAIEFSKLAVGFAVELGGWAPQVDPVN